jgi:hypothetical protein
MHTTLDGFAVAMPATIYRATPAFATANVAASSVREGSCGIVGGLIGRSDPEAEPNLVSTFDHIIWAKRVDTREIDPVFGGSFFSFLYIRSIVFSQTDLHLCKYTSTPMPQALIDGIALAGRHPATYNQIPSSPESRSGYTPRVVGPRRVGHWQALVVLPVESYLLPLTWVGCNVSVVLRRSTITISPSHQYISYPYEL